MTPVIYLTAHSQSIFSTKGKVKVTELYRLWRVPSRWHQRFLNRLNIAHKIIYSTFVTVGISVSGTLVGLGIGDNQQQKAQQQLSIINQYEGVLLDLEIHSLRVRTHPQRLVATLENPLWFRYEVGQFEINVKETQALYEKLRQFPTTKLPGMKQALASSEVIIHQTVDDYEIFLPTYVERFEKIWSQIDPLELEATGRDEAQRTVLTLILEEEVRKFDIQFEKLAAQLAELRDESIRLHNDAQINLTAATQLRSRIIIGSISVSLLLVTVISLYTARAIASPLKQVKTIAQQATADSNYTLRAPITTQDEVGSLAQSFNQLIRQVQQQLNQLQAARDLLEVRVAERTQDLEVRVAERTQELEDTLQNLCQTQAQLIQTEKMSSLGEMVAGIAHEINNPVSFIHGNITHGQDYLQELLGLIELYEAQYPEPKSVILDYRELVEIDYLKSDFLSLFDSMKLGTQRIEGIIKSLRNFSRLDEAEVKDVDLHQGLDSTLVILGNKLKQQIKIIKNYGDIPLIYCYPSQLNQVFLNILANGIDALMSLEMCDRRIMIQTGLLDDHWVKVSIKDNGPGIPESVKTKIFNPFFTTKPIGQGTGLGLSIAYQIIEKHSGKIEVISEPNQGTEFVISLPIQTSAIVPLLT